MLPLSVCAWLPSQVSGSNAIMLYACYLAPVLASCVYQAQHCTSIKSLHCLFCLGWCVLMLQRCDHHVPNRFHPHPLSPSPFLIPIQICPYPHHVLTPTPFPSASSSPSLSAGQIPCTCPAPNVGQCLLYMRCILHLLLHKVSIMLSRLAFP